VATLDNPPFGEEETLGALGSPDNRQADVLPGPQSSQPGNAVFRIRLIGPDPPHPEETVAETCQQ
jgi:hypothetical protein